MLHDAVHAGDADRGQQAADGGRDQADQQGNQNRHARNRSRPGLRNAEDRVGLQRDDGQQEDQRQAGDQDVQRDLVRRLLAFRALDQGDHAVQEGLAGIGCDLDLDLIRQHLGAAGHGAAVAARFANDRRALAGDHGFVHGRDAFDHLAVSGDQVAGFAKHDIAGAQRGSGNLLDLSRRVQPLCQRIGLGLAQGVGLSLSARFRHGFGEVGEQHREPEPERDLN